MVEAVVRARFERPLAWGIVILAIVHYVVFLTSFYQAWYPIDMLMHFACGAWFGCFGYYFLFVQGSVRISSRLYAILVTASFVALIGVTWEFHEFVADLLISDPARIMQTSVADTMSDLFFDILGGMMAATVITHYAWSKHSRSVEGKN